MRFRSSLFVQIISSSSLGFSRWALGFITISRMDKLANLHKRLRVIAGLLDGAASNIRDVPLSPTHEHIQRIGEALVSVFEIQSAIYKLRPELEVHYEEPQEEVSAANKRLGETLMVAYDLADNSKLAEAVNLLIVFEKNEPSEFHRSIAAGEIERLNASDET